MTRSKIGTVCDLITGASQFREDGLHDYHVAREIVNAGRCRSLGRKFAIIRLALNSYRIMVSIREEQIRLYRPDTQTEVLI